MSARIIDGKAIAAELRAKVAAEVKRLSAQHGVDARARGRAGRQQSGERVYVGSKAKVDGREPACARSITACRTRVSEAELLALVGEAQRRSGGARHPGAAAAAASRSTRSRCSTPSIRRKDVDGFHPVNAGRLASGLPALVPCTPLGCVMLAKTVHASLAGLEAVVIGRSNIVGKPVAQLLLAENATVTVAHSRTRDLPAVCRRADLLVAAVGRPEMVRGDWIKPGATVIDVGINRVPGADGKTQLVGDVAFRRSRAGRRRDHAGAGRRRPDDHRLPAGQHACARPARIAGLPAPAV